MADPNRAIVFFCDGCGKALDDSDPGEFFWDDYERFMATVGQEDEEPTLLLCGRCFGARGRGHEAGMSLDP